MARRPPFAARLPRCRAVHGVGALALAVAAACVPAQPIPTSSLAGSRQLVTVSFPTQQSLRASAAGRDTVLERVSDVVGWPTGVRGDTLALQVSRWRADGRVHTLEPADYVVVVPPEAGARVRAGEQTGGGFPLMVVGALLVLGAATALAIWYSGGIF